MTPSSLKLGGRISLWTQETNRITWEQQHWRSEQREREGFLRGSWDGPKSQRSQNLPTCPQPQKEEPQLSWQHQRLHSKSQSELEEGCQHSTGACREACGGEGSLACGVPRSIWGEHWGLRWEKLLGAKQTSQGRDPGDKGEKGSDAFGRGDQIRQFRKY